jgi:DNA-binding response OmpR family regulator
VSKTILIVDDDRATSALLQTLLQIEGYDSLACPRPDEVLGTIREYNPDLVLMDYHLANVESLEILHAIRADDELKTVPVIMTSGMDRSLACMKAGANAFVLKPFKPSDLLDVIKKQLAQAEQPLDLQDVSE